MQLGKQLAETTFARLTGLFLALLSIILLTQTSTKECLFPNPKDLFLAKGWQARPSRARSHHRHKQGASGLNLARQLGIAILRVAFKPKTPRAWRGQQGETPLQKRILQ